MALCASCGEACELLGSPFGSACEAWALLQIKVLSLFYIYIYISQFCDYRVATLNFEILRLMLGSGEKPQVPALGA